MELREQGIDIIKQRIIEDKDILGLKSIKRNSNQPVNKNKLNAIYIFENEDIITKHASNDFLGYPARRMLELEIQLISQNDRDGKGIKDLFLKLRRTVLCKKENDIYIPEPTLIDNVFVRELKTIGAGTYEIPELIGMKMILGLHYIDNFNITEL